MTDSQYQLTPEASIKLREQFRKATATAAPGRFEHFSSDEQRQAHLDDVAAGVERGTLPF